MLSLEVVLQPWIIDANDINETNVDDFISDVLLKNRSITDFMHKDSNVKFVVAPKGFGKTLMLKLKRQISHYTGARFIPQTELIDKPSGQPAILSEKDLQGLVEDSVQWQNIWMCALSLAVLKSNGNDIGDIQCERLADIASRPSLLSPGDLFDQILSLSSKERVEAYQDYKAVLLPLFRTVRNSHAIFIDNIDEYFGSVLTPRLISTTLVRGSVAGWVYSQCGLISAARELCGINHHIKIFASIRSEAFEHFGQATPQGLQLEGESIRLSYSDRELIEIFRNNTKLEQANNLAEPLSKDPITAFIGSENRSIENRYVAESESFEGYLLRHSLRRPRDMVYVGRLLANIPPDRRSQDRVSDEINTAAKQIAANYFAEVLPHVPNLELDALLPLLKSNVMSREEIAKIAEDYNLALQTYYNSDEDFHPFCDLYRIGLLGIVMEQGGAKKKIQKFALPGEVGFLETNVLPDSDFYLVHPILIDHIGPKNTSFKANISDINVIGHGRVWRTPDDIDFIAKADVVGYSEIMASPELSTKFPNYFEKVISDGKRAFNVQAEIEQGDSIKAYGRNPLKVLNFCHFVSKELKSGLFQRDLRVACDAGFLNYSTSNPMLIEGGTALRIAARLEPKVPPSQTVVTDRFWQFFQRMELEATSGIEFEKMTSEALQGVPVIDGKFNIAKSEKEDAILHELYWVKFP